MACKNLATEVSLEDNDLGDSVSLAQQFFGENHAASIVAMKKNGWTPTPASILDDIQKACVEYCHGGVWNTVEYTMKDVVCIYMKACYPSSFLGKGEAAQWFQRCGHPGHCIPGSASMFLYRCKDGRQEDADEDTNIIIQENPAVVQLPPRPAERPGDTMGKLRQATLNSAVDTFYDTLAKINDGLAPLMRPYSDIFVDDNGRTRLIEHSNATLTKAECSAYALTTLVSKL